MKKVSEVCNIVGTTRKTLRGYNDMGLLVPTKKDENNYWYYDDRAILKLLEIQMFVEVGYSRKEIKELFELGESELTKEYDNAINLLTKKRKRIDTMIRMLEVSKWVKKYVATLPKQIVEKCEPARFWDFLKEKNYTECMIVHSYNLGDEDFQIAVELFSRLIQIGINRAYTADSTNIQELVEEVLCTMLQAIRKNCTEEEYKAYSEEEWKFFIAKEFELEGFDEIDTDFGKVYEMLCGNEANEYFRHAFHYYCAGKKHISEKYDLYD